MKTLIVYATKYGSTKEVAKKLAASFEDVTLVNSVTEQIPDLAAYECVIMGSRITAGMVDKSIKSFAKENEEVLGQKRLGIFLCGLQEKGEKEYLEANFSQALVQKAKAVAFLGGVFDPSKCGFLAKAVIKKVAGLSEYTNMINEKKIADFGEQMKA